MRALVSLKFEVSTTNVDKKSNVELFKPCGLKALIILNTWRTSVIQHKEIGNSVW